MENEVKKQESYLTGIIGAILGGLIATIPWVLAYVYGNMMLSLLAVIIAAGEFFGYKLFKGKIDKKLPAIIMVLAVVIVTVVTLLIIPAMLLGKENLAVNMQSIKNLYTYKDFFSAIIRDYLISVVFTILGASVVTSNIKKQLVDGKDPQNIKLNLNNNEAQNKLKQDAINVIKPTFERYNAMDKNNTMTKEEVLAEIENPNEKKYFNYLKNLNIIKKEKGKYYYNVENEKNIQGTSSNGKIFAIAIIIIVVISIISLMLGQSETNVKTISNDDVEFAIENDWNVWSEYDEEYGWSYFKYISEIPTSANNEIANEIDYSIYPAIIGISYDKEDTGEYESINDLKTVLETYIQEKLQPEEYNMNIVVTEKGYSALRTKIKYTSEPEEVDYYYYIYNNGKMAYISGITYNVDDDEELEKNIIDIVNSFDWKE